MMALEQTTIPYRFGLEVPSLGLGMNDLVFSGGGQMTMIRTPVYCVLVPHPNAAVTRRTEDLSVEANQAILTSGTLSELIEEIQYMPLWQEEESVNVVRTLTKEDRARLHINTFLGEVYSLAQLGDTDGAGYKIFDFLDRVLCDGFFAVCDDILNRIDVEKLPTTLMRSFLSITAPAKKKLPSRGSLYKRTEKKMIELRGELKTRRILGNLG